MTEKELQQAIQAGELKVAEPTGAASAQNQNETNPLKPTFEEYLPWLELLRQGKIGSGAKKVSGFASRTSAQGIGQQAVTGIGFKPSFIRITAYNPNANGSISHGAGNVASQPCVERYFDGTNWQSYLSGYILYVRNSGGSQIQYASLLSLDDDGFTLNWGTFGGSSTIFFTYECYE